MENVKFLLPDRQSTAVYPNNITVGLEIDEARVIACVCNDLSLMCELEGRGNLFNTEDGQLYYSLLNDMHKNKVQEFEIGAVQASLARLGEKYRLNFEQNNGMGHLNAVRKDLSTSNFESYLDTLIKANTKLMMYREFYSNMFDIASGTATNIDTMIQGAEVSLDKIRQLREVSAAKPEVLRIDDKYVQSKIDGAKKGIPYGLKSISRATRGMHLSNMSMLAMPVNNGKTTINYNEIMMDFLDLGESIFIYSNESGADDFKDMLLIRTLTKHLKYKRLNRTKINNLDIYKTQNPSDFKEYMSKINEAKAYIDLHYSERLVLYSVSRYSIAEFNMLHRRYAYKGFKYFLIDTMKSEDAGDANAVGRLVQQSRTIYEMARKLNTHVMVSYQIASYLKQSMKRVLDESCLSGSKQIVEILDILITGRELYPDEYPNQKREVKVFNLDKSPDGKYYRKYVTLESDKKYLIMFLPKNRYGEKIYPTLHVFNGNFGNTYEVGVCENVMDR